RSPNPPSSGAWGPCPMPGRPLLIVHVDVDVLEVVGGRTGVEGAGLGVDGHEAAVHAEGRAVDVAVGLGAVGAVGVARDERVDVGPEGHEPAVLADGGVGSDVAASRRAGGLRSAALDARLIDRAGLEVLPVDVLVAAG